MSALPYHKRYHGDALTGFMGLTLEERGAYQTLLDMIYDRGGPLINNERLLAGYMNCSLRKWRSLRDELIAKGKIRINEKGEITNDRAEKEIENTAKTNRKLVEAGAKGGRNRAENEKKLNENKERVQASPELGSSDPQAIPEARSQSSVDKSTGASAPIDPVKLMFDGGIVLLARAGYSDKQSRSMIGKWRAKVGDDEVRLAIAECQLASISDPLPYLEKRFANPLKPRFAQPAEPKPLWQVIAEREALDRAIPAGAP